MKITTPPSPSPPLPILLLLLSTLTHAHWNYNRLIVNDRVIGSPYQYVRETNNSNSPLQNVNSTDMRCNSGASTSLNPTTQTYTLPAGSSIGFTIADHFGHPGPQQVYLSPSPPGVPVSNYDGSGEWKRIYSLTLSNDSAADPAGGLVAWATHRMNNFTFVLPREVEAGEYLLRAEGLALHAAHKVGDAQFYVGCAQINVTAAAGADGSADGDEGETVKFPGAYTGFEPGVLIPIFWSMLTNYTAPGPALWPVGTQEEHLARTIGGES